MVYSQLLAKLKSRVRVRNLLARQCMAEFLAEFVLMVGRVLGEGTRMGWGAAVWGAAWLPAPCPPCGPCTTSRPPSSSLPSFHRSRPSLIRPAGPLRSLCWALSPAGPRAPGP